MRTFILTLFFLFFLSPLTSLGQTSTQPEGSGTSGDPYKIASLENLYWFSQNEDKWTMNHYYVQTADIDATDTEIWDGEAGFSPIGWYEAYDNQNQFRGSYDGQGYSISNLTINRPTERRIGLFGATNHATIKNLKIINADITGEMAGTIIGRAYGNNTIKNCYATGSVTSKDTYTGGLVAWFAYSDMVNCISNVTVSGTSYTGGLVGHLQGSNITQSYNLGDISPSSAAWNEKMGGIAGAANSNSAIDNCYSAGSISGGTEIGGIVSIIVDNSQVSNSYWDTQASGTSVSAGGNGLTTSEMQGNNAEAEMNGFNFDNVWATVDNSHPDATGDGYPVLKILDRYVQLELQGLLVNDNLILLISPEIAGTSSGQGQYNAGEDINVSASENAGYIFENWTNNSTGNVVSNTASFTYTMPSEARVALTANYIANDYEITTNNTPAEGGSINLEPNQDYYHAGNEISIAAVSNSGYIFKEWSGDTVHLDNTEAKNTTLTMPAEDISITAIYEQIDYSLIFENNPTEAGNASAQPVQDNYNLGEEVIFTATPDAGYELINWTDALTDTVISDKESFEHTIKGIEQNALQFNETEDYVNIPHDTSLEVDNTVTVEAWIYPTDLSSRHTIFSTRSNNATGSWQVEVGKGNNNSEVIAVTGPGTWVAVSEDNVITLNEWNHIAFVRDGESDAGTFYVNGSEVNLQEQTSFSFADNTDAKTIGVGNFKGKIDEVRVWNIARTENEIQEEMPNVIDDNNTNLTAYYRMDYGEGVTAKDYSSNNNNGTLEGNPQWVNNCSEQTRDTTITFIANYELGEYQLSIDSNPNEGGSVDINPEQETYNMGDEITLTANPQEGYEFVNWTDAGDSEISTNAEYTHTMPADDDTIKANFAAINYQLTTNINPQRAGTVTLQPEQDYYNMGDEITLTADPQDGHEFISWKDSKGEIVSEQESFEYTMPAEDITLVARFETNTGIEGSKISEIEIWPNPFDVYIRVNNIDKIANIEIVSLTGETIHRIKTIENKINTSFLDPGVYLLKLTDKDGEVKITKLIKQ